MPRHVARALAKRVVLQQQQCTISLKASLPHRSEVESHDGDTNVLWTREEHQRNSEEIDHLLRTEDQSHLRTTISAADKLTQKLNAAKEYIESLPTTIEPPRPGIPKYKLAQPKVGPNGRFSKDTNRALEKIGIVRQHLLDLTYQPYLDQKASDLVQFEMDLHNKSEEEIEALYKRKCAESLTTYAQANSRAQSFYANVMAAYGRLGLDAPKVKSATDGESGEMDVEEVEDEDEERAQIVHSPAKGRRKERVEEKVEEIEPLPDIFAMQGALVQKTKS